MLLIFEVNKIKVIRLGLYPGEDLRTEGVISAGPFHPSFGEIVEQEIYKDQLAMLIDMFLQNITNQKLLKYM